MDCQLIYKTVLGCIIACLDNVLQPKKSYYSGFDSLVSVFFVYNTLRDNWNICSVCYVIRLGQHLPKPSSRVWHCSWIENTKFCYCFDLVVCTDKDLLTEGLEQEPVLCPLIEKR